MRATGISPAPTRCARAAFLEFANDPGIDAIWFLRGGYGANRLLAHDHAAARPGGAAQDVSRLFGRRLSCSARFTRGGSAGPSTARWRATSGASVATRRWRARSAGWCAAIARGWSRGWAGRPAAAFNLTILTALAGTPWLPDLADHVLLVEEVSEAMYAIDRKLFQLAHATQLKGIAGIRLGALTDVQPNDPPWGEEPDAMMTRWCGEMGVPYLGRAEIGHTQANRVVPFGVA